jgi:hypothetical protein
MSPYTVAQQPQLLQPRPGYVNLTPELRGMIRSHTAARFVVQQSQTVRVSGIVDGVGIRVPWILRIEFKLMPRTVFSHPEFSMRITEVIDPMYMQSREFEELSAALSQEKLQQFDYFVREREAMNQVTFPAIERLFVRLDTQNKGELLVKVPFGKPRVQHRGCTEQCFSTPSGMTVGIVTTPVWCAVLRTTWEEVREKLQSVFHMELVEI